MHPFIQIFDFQLPSFGLMMTLAAVASFGLLALRTRGTGYWPDTFNLYFMAVIGGLGGAFLLYAGLAVPSIIKNWDTLIKPLPFMEGMTLVIQSLGGFVFYGGLIGGVGCMFLYARAFKMPLLLYLDIFAPVLPVAHAIGRIGCFLGGCCFGAPVDSDHWLAVVYPPESLGAPSGVPLLAVPLIEAAVDIIIAVGLVLLPKFKRLAPGQLTLLYVMAYAVTRFILEFYRGDIIRGVYFGVSTSQVISVVLLILCAAAYLYTRNKKQISEKNARL